MADKVKLLVVVVAFEPDLKVLGARSTSANPPVLGDGLGVNTTADNSCLVQTLEITGWHHALRAVVLRPSADDHLRSQSVAHLHEPIFVLKVPGKVEGGRLDCPKHWFDEESVLPCASVSAAERCRGQVAPVMRVSCQLRILAALCSHQGGESSRGTASATPGDVTARPFLASKAEKGKMKHRKTMKHGRNAPPRAIERSFTITNPQRAEVGGRR